jgi:hypothetical protein
MKKFWQKIKKVNILPSLLVLLIISVISIFSLGISWLYAQSSYLGGASNNLVVQGGAVIGATSVTTGLAVPNGNVGIGITNPSTKLHISGDVLSTGAHYFMDTNHRINAIFGVGLGISTYGVDNGIILRQDSGNVGIGTTNPSQKLHIQGTSYFDGKVGIGTASPDSTAKLDVRGGGGILVNNTDSYGIGIQAGGYWGVYAVGEIYGVYSNGDILTNGDIKAVSNS